MNYQSAYISYNNKNYVNPVTEQRKRKAELSSSKELSAQEKILCSKVKGLGKEYSSKVAREAEYMLGRIGHQLRPYVRDKIKAELVFVMMVNNDV